VRVGDRAQIAAAVYGVLAMRWRGRFDRFELSEQVSLGSEGLGLDSIEIVELLLDCEEQVGRDVNPDALLETGPISIGRLIDHLARP
jgi:acyl carrier protein